MKRLSIKNRNAAAQLLGLLLLVSVFGGSAFAHDRKLSQLPAGTTVTVIKPINIIAGDRYGSLESSKCSISISTNEIKNFDRIIPAGMILSVVATNDDFATLHTSDGKVIFLDCGRDRIVCDDGFCSYGGTAAALDQVKYETSWYLAFSIPGAQPF